MTSKLKLCVLAMPLAFAAFGAQPVRADMVAKVKDVAKTIGGGVKSGAFAAGRGIVSGAKEFGTFAANMYAGATDPNDYGPQAAFDEATATDTVEEPPVSRNLLPSPGLTVDHRGNLKIVIHRKEKARDQSRPTTRSSRPY